MRGKFPICLGERFAPTGAFAAFFGKVAFDLLNNYILVNTPLMTLRVHNKRHLYPIIETE